MRGDRLSGIRAALLVSVATLVLACGDEAPSAGPPAGSVLTIRNYEFLPHTLVVAAGAAVLVRNEDPFEHSVTSETAPGLYAPGAVQGISFDTGPFTGTRTIAIPASAAPGTVIPFFCTVHGAALANQGELVVGAP
jgi:plastocyanin